MARGRKPGGALGPPKPGVAHLIGPPSPQLPGLLRRLAPHVENHYYKGQVVYLDGYTFTNCCFHNCTLYTATGVFAIQSCTFMGCEIHVADNAVRIIQLHNLVETTFLPVVGDDGAVTIR